MNDVHSMRDGFALHLDPGDPLQRAMAAQRRYESDVTWVYPYLLRPGDRVVDGGAHIGYLTLLASRCVGPSGEVHAFEPVPRTFAALEENVRLNGAANVRLNRVALAARAGEIELEVPIDPDGEGLLAWGATSVHLGRGSIERAPAQTLDEYARAHRLERIALLKLDLEGAELEALRGMDELLRGSRIAYIVCELNTFLADAQGQTYDATREYCQRFGYRAYDLGRVARLRRIEKPIVETRHLVTDLLFVAPRRTGNDA
ncbi:MAG: FkbM family methyltransferase [Chloroflexota bacterium]